MDINTIKKYIDKNVMITCKNGWKYKIFLKKEYVTENGLSFLGMHNEPVDFDYSFVEFITCSDVGGFE